MAQNDNIRAYLQMLLTATENYPTETREQAIRLECAVTQIKAAKYTLEKLFEESDHLFVKTDKSEAELCRIFEELVKGGFIGGPEGEARAIEYSGRRRSSFAVSTDKTKLDASKVHDLMRGQFLDIFNSDPTAKNGFALWTQRHRNRPIKSGLVDLLCIMGVEQRSISYVAWRLFGTYLSGAPLWRYTKGKENSARHEELQRIWNGTHSK